MSEAVVPIGARIKIAAPLWNRLPEQEDVIVELSRAEIEPDGTWLLTVTRLPDLGSAP